MRILVTNDDGFDACGLAALVKVLTRKHDVFVCAPKVNQSAVAHGLTISSLLYPERVQIPGSSDVTAFCVNGTPADCVRAAIGNLGCRPDIVISGINQAPNLGTDALYSGTVAAASEAAMLGIRAIAVSKDGDNTEYFEDTAEVFYENLDSFINCLDAEHRLLNVNFPSIPREKLRGIRTGNFAEQVYPVEFDIVPGKDGAPDGLLSSSLKLTVCGENDTTDEKRVRDGYIAVTPLTYDLTDYRRMETVKNLIERDF